MECNYVLVTTLLGFEKTCASYISELDPDAKVSPRPRGFKGLVLVEPSMDKWELARLVEERVPEAEKVVVAEECSEPNPRAIAEKAARLAEGRIRAEEAFAVRTNRRGRHGFTSVDVNVVVGDAVRRASGASVNLSNPDKVVLVEIVQDLALLSIIPGSKLYRKMRPGKRPVYRLFRRISLVHMPYLGPLESARVMGRRVGREVQTFEVGELVVAPAGRVDAEQLKSFLDGLFEGIESRYRIQEKSYGREVHRVRVYVQDLYQLVRERAGETIIVLEPEGEPVSRLGEELYRLLVESRKRVNVLVGSREGIPSGIYRFADLVVDVAPGVTISTDYAAAAALIAFATILHDRLGGEEQ